MPQVMRRLRDPLLWLIAVSVGLALSVQRLPDASQRSAGVGAVDLRIFLDAAQSVVAGESVYDVDGYVYLPFVAWSLLGATDMRSTITPWAIAAIAAAWCIAVVTLVPLWDRLTRWQRPVVFGVALVALLYNKVTLNQLELGQVDFFVLLLLAGAATAAWYRRSAASGALIAVAALVKTWPVLIGVWLLRSSESRPLRALAGALIAGTAGVLAATALSGPTMIPEWVSRTIELSRQDLVSFSVWGAGVELFTADSAGGPLVVSPVLAVVLPWVLAGGVAALIVIALRWPGDHGLAMWNVAGAVVLLLPVSHISYRLLMLPLVWTWLAICMSRRYTTATRRVAVIALVATSFFWIVTFRFAAYLAAMGSTGLYVAVMLSTMLALAASVFAARALDVSTEGPRDRPASGRSRSQIR
ncbi:glycosyltransferase family 87 protein [Agromyces bracchium]|uniref:glycosyltransferase family 87 protein n=1 Tax=Agromyces bracchium TaxID=88376 RepID=UPI0018ACD2C4|nr:glycosyltransferase family 87 protein [Agromyces bracchium]